jgi:hypothetical protein
MIAAPVVGAAHMPAAAVAAVAGMPAGQVRMIAAAALVADMMTAAGVVVAAVHMMIHQRIPRTRTGLLRLRHTGRSGGEQVRS